MPTHVTQCVVCGANVACCDDEHALGVGGRNGEGGCKNPPYIEFCSLAHARELHRRLTARIALCLQDKPFGFTHQDVADILEAADAVQWPLDEDAYWHMPAQEKWHEDFQQRLKSLAARIAARLPPEEK